MARSHIPTAPRHHQRHYSRNFRHHRRHIRPDSGNLALRSDIEPVRPLTRVLALAEQEMEFCSVPGVAVESADDPLDRVVKGRIGPAQSPDAGAAEELAVLPRHLHGFRA